MLDRICFIGVDEKTDLDEIVNIQNDSKISLEFGVLYSPKRNEKGDPRYPSINFIKSISHYFPSEETAIHLCGDSVEDFFNGDEKVLEICEGFGRIQLNFAMKDYSESKLIDDILSATGRSNAAIIIQHNKSKENLIKKLNFEINELFYHANNLHFLYDASGGFGREAKDFKPVFPDIYTGYAGGIGPHNAADIVRQIEAVNNPNDSFYIDMESQIRENNLFSIEKCRQVIANVIRS